MTQDAVNALVNDLREKGMDDAGVRRTLFNTKGVRVGQIKKAMER